MYRRPRKFARMHSNTIPHFVVGNQGNGQQQQQQPEQKKKPQTTDTNTSCAIETKAFVVFASTCKYINSFDYYYYYSSNSIKHSIRRSPGSLPVRLMHICAERTTHIITTTSDSSYESICEGKLNESGVVVVRSFPLFNCSAHNTRHPSASSKCVFHCDRPINICQGINIKSLCLSHSHIQTQANRPVASESGKICKTAVGNFVDMRTQ